MAFPAGPSIPYASTGPTPPKRGGFHLIVGFADKVRLMNLLMEDFRTYKEIPIKASANRDSFFWVARKLGHVRGKVWRVVAFREV